MARQRQTGNLWAAIPYGVALAIGVAVLQWIEYQRLARTMLVDVTIVVVGVGFLGLGIYLGARVFRSPPPAPVARNAAAIDALGISPRELAVLGEIAGGQSNKEIARALGVSPNTVKTHLARLYEKLGARRRTEALARARELGILP